MSFPSADQAPRYLELRALRLPAVFALTLAVFSCGEKSTPAGSGPNNAGGSNHAAGGTPGVGGKASVTGGTLSALGGNPTVGGTGGMNAIGGGGNSLVAGGGAFATGGTPNAGGGMGGAGLVTPNGTPFVFIGETEGVVRAYTMNPTDGSLTPSGSQAVAGLDFMTVDAARKVVFISGSDNVSAYKYDSSNHTFTFLDSQASTQGTHVAVHPSGKFVFTAGYNPGKMFFHTFSEQAGFGVGQSFSPGMKAHEVRCSASGNVVYVPCLGSDLVPQYTLDPVGGALSASGTATLPQGSGPRHMDFHPSANVAYVLSELSSQVFVFDIEVQSGALQARPADTVFTHPDGQFHQSSDIRVTPSGAFVYAVNRQPNQIVPFKVEANHALTRQSSLALSGEVRAFGVDAAGTFLQVGSKDGKLLAFRIDPMSGALTEASRLEGLGTINVTEVHYLQ
ncbi:MAG: beta-propeller fold lactonase family protein [Polyangiaceae bacterium]|nr:beta-propeller fold lactonase family protein [Polyangiaceae bacterium]